MAVLATFKEGSNFATAAGLWQHSYGQKLIVQGLELPTAIEVHFSFDANNGDSETEIGITKDGIMTVPIPEQFIENEKTGTMYEIYAFIYISNIDEGETIKRITMPVKCRPKPQIPIETENDRKLFRETIAEVNKSAAIAQTAEKSAESWAHGDHENYPDRDEDNAAYYAGEARKDASQTAEDREAVAALAENVNTSAMQVDADKKEAEQYKNRAATSAADALLSEQAAKASETAAREAQAGAEAAEGQAELFALQTEEDKNTVEQAKAAVMEIGQEVAEKKNYVEQTVGSFELLHQQAVADVNNAGQTQTERVEEAGNQAVNNVNAAGAAQVKAVEESGADQVSAVQEAAAEIIADRKQIAENKNGISELKTDITQLGDGNNKFVALVYEAGWIDANGNLVSYDDRWRTTDYYPITENMTMQKVNTSATAYIDYFDSDKKLKTFAQFNDTNVHPISTKYAYFKLVVRNVANITEARNAVQITEQYPLVGKVKELEDLPKRLLSYANLNPKKILTWIDDDTVNIDSINRVKSICNTVGIKCTFSTIVGNWSDSVLQALKDAQDEGYHITTHGYSSHEFWRTSTESDLDGDLAKSLHLLAINGFMDSDLFVYPGSTVDRTDVDIQKIAKKWCRCGVKNYVSGGGAYWINYGQGRYLINRRFFDKSVNADVSYYTNQLDAFSVSDNPWFVFGSHSNMSNQFDADLVTEVLQYAVNNGWEVMTLNEALKYRMKFYEIKDLLSL